MRHGSLSWLFLPRKCPTSYEYVLVNWARHRASLTKVMNETVSNAPATIYFGQRSFLSFVWPAKASRKAYQSATFHANPFIISNPRAVTLQAFKWACMISRHIYLSGFCPGVWCTPFLCLSWNLRQPDLQELENSTFSEAKLMTGSLHRVSEVLLNVVWHHCEMLLPTIWMLLLPW